METTRSGLTKTHEFTIANYETIIRACEAAKAAAEARGDVVEASMQQAILDKIADRFAE